MGMWKQSATIEDLATMQKDSLASYLGVTFKEIGDDFIVATMPVDRRTMQFCTAGLRLYCLKH